MKSRAASLSVLPDGSFVTDIPRQNPFELSRLSAKPGAQEQGRKSTGA
jgi:hypothetical protein